MQEGTTASVTFPSSAAKDVLTEILREGAQQMLATAIEAEVADWIESHSHLKDERGHRQVVRNGYLPERNITTGVGDVPVQQPRVHDRRPEGEKEKFTSKILPPYLRKTKSIEDLIPWLYLKGISTGDFPQALASLLGPDAAGLSATTVTRLKAHWEEEYGDWREQRCTVHKTANVLDKLPKRLQGAAKSKLHDIWQADTRENANKAFDLFLETYQAKYPKAAECLAKDREVLLAFYDFPAEHWIHLRTTNPIESTFATVRLRHRRTKGNGSRKACLAMVFKLVQAAEKKWRLLNGSQLIPDVIQGVRFINGEREEKAAA